jgi:hypothetical protein
MDRYTYKDCGHPKQLTETAEQWRQGECPDCRFDRGMKLALRAIAVVFFLLAAGVFLALLVGASVAWASETMESALHRLPVFTEDRDKPVEKAAQLRLIAAELAKVRAPKGIPGKEWRALVVAVGFHESAYSLRIHRGECKPQECDRGKARGPWQQQQNDYTRPVWDELHGQEHTATQVREAEAALRRGYFTCAKAGVPWEVAALNGYAGARCGATWPGLDKRLATQRLVRDRL